MNWRLLWHARGRHDARPILLGDRNDLRGHDDGRGIDGGSFGARPTLRWDGWRRQGRRRQCRAQEE
eukprot:4485564-Pyramimonas_sp.AAC.1